MKLLDGRGSFYQWDHDQKLLVEDARVEQLHFSAEENALVCPVYEKDGLRIADVPNILLQEEGILKVFGVCGGRTLYARSFRINPKEKPDDYIYTETQVWTAEQAVEKALEAARESGDFDGPPGPKGDPGAVKFTVVNELPQEDRENAIYLLPATDGTQEDMFHEYIYVDGKWEKIGNAAVAIDLSGYVKNTDIAGNTTAGIVRVMSDYGVQLISLSMGVLGVRSAKNEEIAAKNTAYLPIVPKYLDYAVKIGLTTNTCELTDSEKQGVHAWLGIPNVVADGEDALLFQLTDGSVYRVAATKEV